MASLRTWLAVGLTGIAVVGAATLGVALAPDGRPGRPASAPPVTAVTDDPILVGAGDIASSGSGDSATAKLLAQIPGTVFTIGDNAYPHGAAADFRRYYRPTWGKFLDRTRPAPGNHDYETSGARAYFDYFGAAAGPGRRGYYSYDLGSWHIVSLNSEISMRAGSAQERWLRRDLDASSQQCTLAYWHRPRFTSGAFHAPSTSTGPLVRALYDHHADVIVNGHNHQYERFGKMNPRGRSDSARGIRFFVAGMGGGSHYPFGTVQPHSQRRNSSAYGVLKLTLHADYYDWEFVPVAGQNFTDRGTTACNG